MSYFNGPKGLIIPRFSANPLIATNGEIYYNTTSQQYRFYANGVWIAVGSSTSLASYANDAAFESVNGPGQPGDNYYNTTNSIIRYYNGSWISLIDDSSIQTLENKTIDADDNTILNISNSSVKVLAGIDATKIHDGSVSNTEYGYLDGVTSSIQTQLNSKINNSEKAAPNGVATLDGGGKVPLTQLPSAIMTYEGVWNASTNSPTLADGVGDIGMVYRVGTAGTQDLGSGSISFDVGDYAILNSSLVWEKSDTTDSVVSVNGFNGIVILDTDDIAEGSNLYFTDERAQDSVGTILSNTSTISFTYNDGTPSITANVNSDSITNALLANVPTQTIKGRTTAGTGDPEDLTAAQATAILNPFTGDAGSGGLKGLVPAPVAGDATKFLRGDGVFATVASSGANAALSNLVSVDLNQNLTTTKASALTIDHQLAGQNLTMSTANNGAGSSGNMVFTTGTATVTRGDITFNARVIRFNATAGSDFTGNLTPSASNTYNVGAGSAPWNIVYGRLFLSTVGNFAAGSDFNTSFSALFQTGFSSGAGATGALTCQSGDQIGGGTGAVGTATFRSGNTASGNTNATGAVTLASGLSAGTGATGGVTVSTGAITNASNNSNTGNTLITTGTTNNTSGTPTTGSTTIATGTPTGTNVSTGHVNLTPGTPTGTGTRGKVNVNALMLKLPTGTGDPTGVDDGDSYYNTSTDQLRVYRGGTWRGVTLT